MSKRAVGVSDRNLLAVLASVFAAVASGLLAGSLIVLGGEWFRPTVRSAAQLQVYSGLPVTSLSQSTGRTRKRPSAARSPTLGKFALTLSPTERTERARRVLVLQPAAAGRDVASELARAADKLGRRVLLVDWKVGACDAVGLNNVLSGKVALDAALVRCPQSTIMMLTGDASTLTDQGALASVGKLLGQFNQRFDLLVQRADPYRCLPHKAGELMQLCEERLLVVQRGRAFKAEVIDPLAQSVKVGLLPTGIVLFE